MMRNILTAILLCVILVLNGAGADGKDKVAVQLGMTKQEVTAILGQPDDISFDYRSEQWEYYIDGGFTKYDKHIFVGFDSEGRVVTYRSVSLRPDDRDDDYHRRGTEVGPMRRYSVDEFCMDERAFSVLYDKIKTASFSDSKFDLVEVASLGCYFSCSQCARILSRFSFSSDKLKALQFMAPRISDYQNANMIYSVFDFDSDKALAAEILGGR
ncbi:MAG: DUF4476 domain-containing protein [Bacteroidales bacterium]|nr:DUF4476 domain-containing protein [Bacteroidales bacterium]MDY6000867.1 DUF4476 domain-containing protein [Candidatus Cryptobacteroides sp.]